MQTISVARRPVVTTPLVLLALLAAALALVAESQIKLPLRYPGHRAFYGALALGLMAGAPRALVAGFAAAVGAAVALLAGNAFLILMWLAPAGLVVLGRPRSRLLAAAVVLGAGIAFGLLRYLSLSGLPHHTPDAIRLAGHVGFGAVGAVVAGLAARAGAEGRQR